jgi:hypothetical protein
MLSAQLTHIVNHSSFEIKPSHICFSKMHGYLAAAPRVLVDTGSICLFHIIPVHLNLGLESMTRVWAIYPLDHHKIGLTVDHLPTEGSADRILIFNCISIVMPSDFSNVHSCHVIVILPFHSNLC